MQHDLFHVYTVDQHILQVIRNVRRFTMVEFAHEYPLCSRLIANFERHWLLYVAAMFHDIAKGRGGDHSHLGMLDARRFCRAHGVARDDTRLVEFLVEHHLTMSAVAQKKDLSDPDVIRDFAAVMQSERRLVALYLLTVADIRGTSPKVWNAWKGKLLEDLFRLTRRVLRGDGVSYDVDVQTKQAEALRLLRLYALSDQVGERLWRELDVAYFLRHDPNEIAWQTRNLHFRVDADQPVVKARLSPIGEGLQVMIYARDQPELFARICGYFESIGYSIADAKIHTTRHGYALDTFLVLGSGTSPHYREMISLIEHDLAERLVRQAPLGPTSARAGVAAAQALSDHARGARPSRREGDLPLAFDHRGGPAGAALRDRAPLQQVPPRPAYREDRHARRARRGRLPGQRRSAGQLAGDAAARAGAAGGAAVARLNLSPRRDPARGTARR